MRSTHRALVATPFVAATATWALWMGGQGLTLPASPRMAALGTWYEQAGAGGAAAVVVWAVGLGIAAWLTTAVTLQVLSAWIAGLRDVADTVSPAALHRLAPAVAGLSLSAGMTAAAPTLPTAAPVLAEQDVGPRDAPAPAPDGEGGTATMTRLDPSTSPTTVARSTTSTPTAPTTTGALGDEAPPGSDVPAPPTTAVPPVPAGSSPSAAAGGPSEPEHAGDARDADADQEPDRGLVPSAPPAIPVLVPDLPAAGDAEPTPSGPGETIIVEPGMSFWSIAAEVLADDGRAASERDVARYWRTLIDANRDRLVAAGNPDLLLPGQELVVPAR